MNKHGTKAIYYKTLTEIKQGIKDAGKEGVKVADMTAKDVEFDISVTTDSTDESKIGAGIFVTGIGIGANSKE